MVTAREGSPTYATKNPLKAPHSTPTSRVSRPATGIERPKSWWRMPSDTLVRPMMLATERSISPVMITRVIGSAISMIGAVSRNR